MDFRPPNIISSFCVVVALRTPALLAYRSNLYASTRGFRETTRGDMALGNPWPRMGQKVPMQGHRLDWQRSKEVVRLQDGVAREVRRQAFRPVDETLHISHSGCSRRQPVVTRLKDGSHPQSGAANPWRLRC